jgi:RimJ/RimL family protein N-acetyltransferase
MTDFEIKVLNDKTIEIVSQGIINEAAKWGFTKSDYIKLINAILDLSLTNTPITGLLKNSICHKHTGNKLEFPLTGENIQIRVFDKDTDYKLVKNWLEDSFGRWFLLSRPSIKENTLSRLIKDKKNILGIITLHDSTPIGLMGFLDYDKENSKAELRKLIGEKSYREKGYAKESTMLWIQHGINNLGLKKIYLNTVENNIRNVTLNMEIGFQIEGVLRKECLIDDEYYDLLRMGLIVD